MDQVLDQITGKRVLVTGVTGWVAGPVATALVEHSNTVFGAARFRDATQREPLEAQGVQTISIDLQKARFDDVPSNIDIVLNFAVAKVNNLKLPSPQTQKAPPR